MWLTKYVSHVLSPTGIQRGLGVEKMGLENASLSALTPSVCALTQSQSHLVPTRNHAYPGAV
jgi:hypothetical protein